MYRQSVGTRAAAGNSQGELNYIRTKRKHTCTHVVRRYVGNASLIRNDITWKSVSRTLKCGHRTILGKITYYLLLFHVKCVRNKSIFVYLSYRTSNASNSHTNLVAPSRFHTQMQVFGVYAYCTAHFTPNIIIIFSVG